MELETDERLHIATFASWRQQLQLMPKLLRRSTEDVSLETEQIASDCQAGVDIANILNE